MAIYSFVSDVNLYGSSTECMFLRSLSICHWSMNINVGRGMVEMHSSRNLFACMQIACIFPSNQ